MSRGNDAAYTEGTSDGVRPEIPSIRAGLFFTPPGALPRGRHSVPRDSILEAQRERLMIASTELVAAKGYSNVRIGDIAERAAVSRAVFYECFSDKEACAVASYDRFITVLLTGMAATLQPGQTLSVFVDSAVRAYLTPIQLDPVSGRAFQVELDAMGTVARARRRESLKFFAQALAMHHASLVGADSVDLLPRSAYLGAVYALRQLACDELETNQSPDLLDLVPELTVWLLRLLQP